MRTAPWRACRVRLEPHPGASAREGTADLPQGRAGHLFPSGLPGRRGSPCVLCRRFRSNVCSSDSLPFKRPLFTGEAHEECRGHPGWRNPPISPEPWGEARGWCGSPSCPHHSWCEKGRILTLLLSLPGTMFSFSFFRQ